MERCILKGAVLNVDLRESALAKARRSEGAGAHLRDGSDKNVLFDATKSKTALSLEILFHG